MYIYKIRHMTTIILYLFVVTFFVGCTEANNDISNASDSLYTSDYYNSSLLTTENNTTSSSSIFSWIGYYGFSESAKPDQLMLYYVKIFEEDEIVYADIYIDGFQTMSRLRATVVGDQDHIDLLFDIYLPDNVFEIHKKGDILISFEKKNSQLYTLWGQIQPLRIDNIEPGLYFEYSTDNPILGD
jgi:hypothetical protein